MSSGCSAMIRSVSVCTYSFAAGGVQFLGFSGAGTLAVAPTAQMDVALEIQSAIASAPLRRVVRSFIEHLVLLNVNCLAGIRGGAGVGAGHPGSWTLTPQPERFLNDSRHLAQVVVGIPCGRALI